MASPTLRLKQYRVCSLEKKNIEPTIIVPSSLQAGHSWQDTRSNSSSTDRRRSQTVAVLIVAKYLEETELAYDITFERISKSMKVNNLELAKHKTKMVHFSSKATIVRTVLSRLIPNVRGPRQTRRMLLSSMVTSVLTYGTSV